MKTLKRKERRQFPRIEHYLPLNVSANGYDFVTTTKNISCIGTYCHIDKYVPPFTKIAVKMILPTVSKDTTVNNKVECKGVIVRSENDERGGFNVAIFFNGINESQRKKISQYLNQLLP
ncbi:MAG: hypothetical protein DRP74_05175 [Candidatus Omnitrophota bacterium]|nr:MAG: hypothetical protein DRP74_05175 [Candidatus Omnitrophota bacterium]